ncbi:MAG: class I SAM-dependent methyltransferase [Candidatus Nomurabacteria bacterium]|nr:class I SAM-dependent methyltransferase [Candidatus Nomurabacteria bacterium]
MICQNENVKIILEPKDYKLYKCLDCGLIFARKNKEETLIQTEVYSNYYKEDTGGRFSNIVESLVKMFRFMRAYKIYSINTKAKSILDIGSGRGWILYFLKKYFKYDRAVGTQIAINAFKFSTEKLKLEIYNKDLLELSLEKKFDIVSILHVLEHVEKPEEYIKKIYELLGEEGILFIEVPNYNAWARKITGKHWLALDLKHHLFFFTPKSLTDLLNKYNFKIKKLETFSLEYSTFTSTQSVVNWITDSDSYFFKWLQKRDCNPKIIWHAFLFILFFLPCFLINLILYFSKSGEVITITAQKND